MGVLAVALPAAGCGDRYERGAWWNEVRGDPYALDAIARDVDTGGGSSAQDDDASADGVQCPDVELTTYEGEHITYEEPVRVAEAFEPKLGELERIAADVAREHYGRAPTRLLHFGAFACRTVRGRESRLSEHALGNALDVSGFSIPGADEADDVPVQLPARLHRPFVVSVRRHWSPEDGDEVSDVHREFLHDLIDRLRDEDVFRGIVGPGQSGHEGHFHFDYSPWSYTRL